MSTEAVVTIKVRPVEFDLIRQALRALAENARLDVKNPEATSASRADARTLQARSLDLLAKIG